MREIRSIACVMPDTSTSCSGLGADLDFGEARLQLLAQRQEALRGAEAEHLRARLAPERAQRAGNQLAVEPAGRQIAEARPFSG
jgi:hypothetical protein